MSKKPTYTATLSDGSIAYTKQPDGNLFGQLPLGARPAKDIGSLYRKDGGDPWDGAVFDLPSGRTVTVRRDAA